MTRDSSLDGNRCNLRPSQLTRPHFRPKLAGFTPFPAQLVVLGPYCGLAVGCSLRKFSCAKCSISAYSLASTKRSTMLPTVRGLRVPSVSRQERLVQIPEAPYSSPSRCVIAQIR